MIFKQEKLSEAIVNKLKDWSVEQLREFSHDAMLHYYICEASEVARIKLLIKHSLQQEKPTEEKDNVISIHTAAWLNRTDTRYLQNRNGWWHFVKRIPQKNKYVRRTCGTRSLEEAQRKREKYLSSFSVEHGP
jgi:hypothetical protein|tara:strand:+ start:1388 stop:1786 length:399 start_codon:yes stop_codon:yes gene_type:complete